jgi:hypothetical protein
MWLFFVAWGIDLLVAGEFVFFFLLGLSDGSVSSFNIVLWLGILAALAVVVGGSFALHVVGQRVLAIIVAALLAVPAIGAGLFFLFILISNPRWN